MPISTQTNRSFPAQFRKKDPVQFCGTVNRSVEAPWEQIITEPGLFVANDGVIRAEICAFVILEASSVVFNLLLL